MADGEGANRQLPAIIVAVLVIGTAVAVRQLPYEDSRPAISEDLTSHSTGAQDVEARLWQDPFAALQAHQMLIAKRETGHDGEDLGSDPNHSFARLAGQIRRRNSSVVIMPVIVYGGPYVEDAENRRRTRYAVVSGLGRWEFAPEDARHVGYVETASRVRRECTDSSSYDPTGEARCEGTVMPPYIPYEWFSRATPTDSREDVLLLWLDESSYEGSPLSRLSHVLTELGACQWMNGKLRIAVVEASGSATIDAMFRELRKYEPGSNSLSCLSGASLYSAAATAPSPSSKSQGADGEHANSDASAFTKAEVRFVRTIAKDKIVLQALVDELSLRGVTPAHPDVRVALISESDTEYGRQLRTTLRPMFCAAPAADNCGDRIVPFSYLRGLDGAVPRAPTLQEPTTSKDRESSGSSMWVRRENLERAEQNTQFDYLRRLAIRMHREAKEKGKFAAIGVLGSDIYDKLLVLQAVRPYFPQAVFFSTDMDARLLHPHEYRWARNLLIGSTFGLELHETLQRDIPPFRDAYQSATFLATLTAIWNVEATKSDKRQRLPVIEQDVVNGWLSSPRIFEIGRTAAIDLNPPRAGSDNEGCKELGNDLAHCGSVYPGRHVHQTDWRTIVAVLSLVAALPLLGIEASSRARSAFAAGAQRLLARYRNVHLLARDGAIAAVAVLFLAIIAKVLEALNYEHFAVSEGISIWPTELIRAVAAVLAFVCLMRISSTLRATNATLGREFFAGDRAQPSCSLWDLMRPGQRWQILRRVFAGRAAAAVSDKPADALALWREHLYQSSTPAVRLRVGAAAVTFVIVSLLLTYLLGYPHVPHRGTVALVIDRALLMICAPLTLVLLFRASDAIRLCDKFAAWLSRPDRTAWPEETRDQYSKALGLSTAMRGEYLDYWIDIRFMAQWTKAIGPIIYCPGVIITLLVVARSSFFADWDTPVALVLTFALVGAYIVAALWLLWRAAEGSRRAAVAAISAAYVNAKGDPDPDRQRLTAKLEVMLAEAKSLQEGAFRPLTTQPFVTTTLGIFSSASTLTLLEYFFLNH